MANGMDDCAGGREAEGSATEEDTSQHGKAIGKDKYKDEKESKEEENYNEGHQDPPEGHEHNKESEKTEIEQDVTEKRKAQGKVVTNIKKKKKADKMKDITPMVLIDGNLEKIWDRI